TVSRGGWRNSAPLEDSRSGETMTALGVDRLALGGPPRRLVGDALRFRLLFTTPVRVDAAHGADVCELRAEEQDLRGVIDPQQNHCQRAGRPECRGGPTFPEVEADQIFAEGEEQRRERGAEPDVPPGDVPV